MRGAPAIVALVVLASLPMASADWRMFHNDERHAGAAATNSYDVYREVWWSRKLVGTQVEASPVVSNGVVVTGDWSGKVRAYDAASGNELWNITLAKVVATPAIANGRVFVVDTTGSLVALDLKKGTLLGQAKIGTTLASPTIHEGKIFIGTEGGYMLAFDTETLTLLWTFATNSITDTVPAPPDNCGPTGVPMGAVRGSPAVYDGKVYFGALNHYFYAINEQGEPTGVTLPQWYYKTGDAIFGSPAIDVANERVLFGSFDEHVYSFEAGPADEGTIYEGAYACNAGRPSPVWDFQVPSGIGSSKVQSTVAIAAGLAVFGANNGRVYALHSQDGTKVWEFATGAGVVSSPAIANGTVVVGSDDSHVYWLNLADGVKAKDFAADSQIKSSPAIDGNRAFVGSFDGSIYMFGPKQPPRPDLSINAITYDGAAIKVEVHNGGDFATPATTVRVEVDGALVADVAVPVIFQGTNATVAAPIVLVPGPHAITATADIAKAASESNEANNALTSTVTAAPVVPGTTGSGGVNPLPSKSSAKKGLPAAGAAALVCLLAALAMARRR